MNLLKVEHKNQRVLTTEQLALAYGASERNMEVEQKNIKQEFPITREQTAAVKEETSEIREAIEINPGAEWRKKTNLIISKICKGMNNYRIPKDDIYNELEKRAKCKLKKRLNNLKVRALSEGMIPCKVNQLNNLDVIDNDPKLKEMYITIVKQKAIKHGIRLND